MRPVLRHKTLLILLAIFVCSLAGCATAPEKFPYQTISINDTPYFSLITMCQQEGIKWDYDPLSKVIILKKPGLDLKLLIGSRKIMVGEAAEELNRPVEIKNSVIYVPVSLRNYIQPPLCKPSKKEIPLAPAYLRPIATIVLDAGHGGKDPGAIGRHGLKEKSIVLDVAEGIKNELDRCGLKVYLTRSGDEFVQLANRPKMANEKKADLFVSIHANANRSRKVEGFEVYYLTEAVDDDARALVAAENFPLEAGGYDSLRKPLSLKATLWDMIYTENRKESIELAQYISNAVSKEMNLKLLGVKGAPFIVLKSARMPAVLVEIGYVSNGSGEKKLQDPEYRRKMAQAIARGIINFKEYCEGKI